MARQKEKLDMRRLRRAMRAIEEEARKKRVLTKRKNRAGRWNQTTWFTGHLDKIKKLKVGRSTFIEVPVDCGSSMCFAGTVVAQAGAKFVVPDNPWLGLGDIAVASYCLPRGGSKKMLISEHARKLIGFTPKEASMLFEGGNTYSDLKRMVTEFCAERGQKF